MSEVSYCLGFIFNEDETKVLMLKKNKPDWQLGMLNGIGGKRELFDGSMEGSMVRECTEETKIITTEEDWYFIGNMYSNKWMVNCFKSKQPTEKLEALDGMVVDEGTLMLVDVNSIISNKQMLPSCKYLIPLALQKDHVFFNVEYYTHIDS